MQYRRVTKILLRKFDSKSYLSISKITVLLSICCFVVAILDCLRTPFISDIHSTLREFSMPLIKQIHQGIDVIKYIPKYIDIKNENEILRKELHVIKLNKVLLDASIQELKKLKEELNLNIKDNNLIEKVLGVEKNIYSSNIIISRNNQVDVLDFLAMTQDGLVGIVIHQYQHNSEILPITSSKILIPVKTTSGASLIISGCDDNEMISREIYRNDILRIKIGDILLTSGEGGFFIKDIPVAKVVSIESSKNEIKAKPVVDMMSINYLWLTNHISFN